jgi:hypothetical protein
MESDTTPTQVTADRPAPKRRAKRPAAFLQSDLTRAIKAAKAAGVQDPVVRIEPSGVITVSSAPSAVPSLGEPNDWD